VPDFVALRRLLKVLLRAYGFECVEASEIVTSEPNPALQVRAV